MSQNYKEPEVVARFARKNNLSHVKKIPFPFNGGEKVMITC